MIMIMMKYESALTFSRTVIPWMSSDIWWTDTLV